MKCYICGKKAEYWISDIRPVCKYHFGQYEKWVNREIKAKLAKTETTMNKGQNASASPSRLK